MPILMLLF